MKPKHTPGPWEIENIGTHPWVVSGAMPTWKELYANCSDDPQSKVYVCDFHEPSYYWPDKGRQLLEQTNQANADRIVACVNACEGIDDPSVVPEVIQKLHGLVETMACEIRAIGPWNVSTEGKRIEALVSDTIKKADALLARAEGRK